MHDNDSTSKETVQFEEMVRIIDKLINVYINDLAMLQIGMWVIHD
ncbi:hypothetical protein [Bacillus cereus]|nr:hypothetical protein [Bacillus cereus]